MMYNKAGLYKRRALAVLMTLCMMAGMLPPLTMTVHAAVPAETAVTARLYALRERYPQNCYWNHAGPDLNGYGVTDRPCPSHDSYATCNSYVYNGDISYQCRGFAKTVFEEVFGQKCDDLPKNYDIENVMAGDYVRFGDEYAGHSFIVLERSGDEVTVLECNIGGRCIIQWGRVQSLSGALNYGTASHPHYVYFNYSVHASNYDQVEMPAGSEMPEDPSYCPVPDGDYYIVSALEGDPPTPDSHYLGIDGAPDTCETDGANAALWPGYGNEAFLFTVAQTGNGFYRIKPKGARNHSLGITDASTQAGANVQLCGDDAGQTAQQWWIGEREDGAGYIIRARCSGFYLGAEDTGTADGTKVRVWVDDGSFAQCWYLILWGKSGGQTIPDGRYRIAARAGRVIGVNATTEKQQTIPLQENIRLCHRYKRTIYSSGKYPGSSRSQGYHIVLLWIIAGVLAVAGGCFVILSKKRKKELLTTSP